MRLDPRQYSVNARSVHLHIEQQSFQDLMAEQLRHGPWLMLSAAVHAAAVMVLLAIPADRRVADRAVVAIQNEPEAEQLDEPLEPEEKPVVEDVMDEPVLQDQEVEVTEDAVEAAGEEFTAFADADIDPDAWNTAVGLGGGGRGSKFGKRGGGRRALSAKGGRDTAVAIELGLEWLKQHQDEDGGWDADDFFKHDLDDDFCDGAGGATYDVGVTGLALLAFLGDGTTMRAGPYRDVVKGAVRWLRDQQDERGLFGTEASHTFIYDHAIATLAMVEAYGLSDYKLLRRYAQRGIDYLELHRNRYGVWRYQPRDNQNDTSVTGWAVMVYKSAQDFGLQVNPQALRCCEAWFEEITEPATGRCGYMKRGEPSSRLSGDHAARFPRDRGEALTAVGLMCRFFLGQDPQQMSVMTASADTILAASPVWDESTGSVDHYYWYYGTYALYQMGGRHWRQWSRKLGPSVLRTQRKTGHQRGSWDPAGVWGEDGGRIYSTAMLVLTLEVYYRYTRVLVR